MLLDLYSLWSAQPSGVVAVSQIKVLYQADILVDGIAGSTEFNRIKLSLIQGIKEATQFGDPARWYKPGIYGVAAEGEFYYQTGNAGAFMVNELEAATQGPTSIYPLVVSMAADQSIGSIVNIWKGVSGTLGEFAGHGEIVKVAVAMEGAGRCVQAKRLLRAPQSGTSGTGQAVNLGAASSAQGLYAALHVVGAGGHGTTGTTFSVISAPTSTLAGPTTRLTFAAGTSAIKGEWQESLGAVTDTWYAAQWTGFADFPSFTASISAGVD